MEFGDFTGEKATNQVQLSEEWPHNSQSGADLL